MLLTLLITEGQVEYEAVYDDSQESEFKQTVAYHWVKKTQMDPSLLQIGATLYTNNKKKKHMLISISGQIFQVGRYYSRRIEKKARGVVFIRAAREVESLWEYTFSLGERDETYIANEQQLLRLLTQPVSIDEIILAK